MAKIDEKVLWGAAEKLRDKCDPADYKNVVLGLVFLKYVSDKFLAKFNELKASGEGIEHDDDYYIADHVFIVPEKALWPYIASYSKNPSLGQIIDTAFEELEKRNNELKGILPKTYSKSDLDKVALGELVDFFTTNLKMEEADGDFFGQIYEFYIGAFATYIPQKGGEFFTPQSIVELMVDILQPYRGRVFDPCCGSGGMFVQCSKFVKEHQGNVDDISIYGQESNPGTWKMAKMNLAIRGLSGDLGESNGDSFTNDLHKSLRADFILANPPYNVKDYWKPSLDGDPRWVFGTPDKKNANYAWLELMYAKLAPKGKAAILMPNGATASNTTDDKKVRTQMLKEGKVDAIISLPDKMFSNVGISVQCWILNKAKTDTDVLFINATDMGTMVSRKLRKFNDADIDLIANTYHKYKSGSYTENDDKLGFCKKASLKEIENNDYSLNPGRYVGVDETGKLSAEEINEQIKKFLRKLWNKPQILNDTTKEKKMNKGYIYILTNPSFPDYVKIGYADDVSKRLQQLNRSECIPFAFRVYATYEVSSRLSDIKIHELIDRLNPDLRAIENFDGKKRVREFYAMTAEDAYGLLKSIAEINGMEEKLKLVKPSQEEIKQEQIAEEIEQKSRGEIFSFSKCQIPVGAELVYINDDSIKCYVVDDRKIKYHDEVMYMTTLAKLLTGKKVGIAGPAFFKYNGENLQHYYDLYQAKK